MKATQTWTFSASPATGDAWEPRGGTLFSGDLTVVGNGAVSAAGVIEVSNTPAVAASWKTLFTFGASGTNAATDSAVAQASWTHARARITGLSGTIAEATFSLSVGGC